MIMVNLLAVELNEIDATLVDYVVDYTTKHERFLLSKIHNKISAIFSLQNLIKWDTHNYT